MAEILGTVGFIVSAPGVALSFCQIGKYMLDRFDAFKNAPENVLELKEFFRDMHQGTLKTNIELAEWAFTISDLDPALIASLENQLRKLHHELQTTNKTLDALFHPDGSLKKRTKYLEFFGLTPARTAMEKLRKWQDLFQGSIALVTMKKLVVPDDKLLTSAKFKPITQTGGGYCSQLKLDSHIWLGKGEARNGMRNGEPKNAGGHFREISFVMERLEPSEYTNVSDAKDIVSHLARQLANKPSDRGILPCLGYRELENNGLELVFELSEFYNHPQTLSDIIAGDIGKGYAGGRLLDHRLRLGREISEAVLSVHTAKLVHKNIRPETILIFQSRSVATNSTSSASVHEISPSLDPVGLGIPFLTNWKMVRKVDDLSSRRGMGDWMADIYRHPTRHGLQPESRYNMKHDIYSLGICLLEIGLWEPFIVDKGQKKWMSDTYCKEALRSGKLKPNETDNIVRVAWPKAVQEVMVALANQELPQRMGLAYSEFVIFCLTCLEDDEISKEEDIGVKFNAKLLCTFTDLHY